MNWSSDTFWYWGAAIVAYLWHCWVRAREQTEIQKRFNRIEEKLGQIHQEMALRPPEPAPWYDGLELGAYENANVRDGMDGTSDRLKAGR